MKRNEWKRRTREKINNKDKKIDEKMYNQIEKN